MTKVHFLSQDLRQLKRYFIISLANLQNSGGSGSFLVGLQWLHEGLGDAGGVGMHSRKQARDLVIAFLFLWQPIGFKGSRHSPHAGALGPPRPPRSFWSSHRKLKREGALELSAVVICVISFRQVPLNASSSSILSSLFAFQGAENRHNYILRETLRFPLISSSA